MKIIMTLIAGALLSVFCVQLNAIEIGEYTNPEKTIKSEPGKIIVITVQSNKTTGYEWQIAKPLDTNIVDFMKSEYVPHATAMMGSGGMEIWSFRAMGPGPANIELKYVRPWEKDMDPVKVMTFKIDVIEPVSDADNELQY